MNERLIEQIRRRMEEKSTEKLPEIWKDNDRMEWSDEAFAAVHKILVARGENPPPQARITDRQTGTADYEYPVRKRSRRVQRSRRGVGPGGGGLFWTLSGLLLSVFYIWFAIGVKEHDVPVGDYRVFLAGGFLLCGANLYVLVTTEGFGRWKNLPEQTKAIAAITIAANVVSGVLAIAFVCLWLVFKSMWETY